MNSRRSAYRLIESISELADGEIVRLVDYGCMPFVIFQSSNLTIYQLILAAR